MRTSQEGGEVQCVCVCIYLVPIIPAFPGSGSAEPRRRAGSAHGLASTMRKSSTVDRGFFTRHLVIVSTLDQHRRVCRAHNATDPPSRLLGRPGIIQREKDTFDVLGNPANPPTLPPLRHTDIYFRPSTYSSPRVPLAFTSCALRATFQTRQLRARELGLLAPHERTGLVRGRNRRQAAFHLYRLGLPAFDSFHIGLTSKQGWSLLQLHQGGSHLA